MKVFVYRVDTPPFSTLGYGYGQNDDGQQVVFAGKPRSLRVLGEALGMAEFPIEVEVEASQIVKEATRNGWRREHREARWW